MQQQQNGTELSCSKGWIRMEWGHLLDGRRLEWTGASYRWGAMQLDSHLRPWIPLICSLCGPFPSLFETDFVTVKMLWKGRQAMVAPHLRSTCLSTMSDSLTFLCYKWRLWTPHTTLRHSHYWMCQKCVYYLVARRVCLGKCRAREIGGRWQAVLIYSAEKKTSLQNLNLTDQM